MELLTKTERLETARKLLVRESPPVPPIDVIDSLAELMREGDENAGSTLLKNILDCYPAEDDKSEMDRFYYMVRKYEDVKTTYFIIKKINEAANEKENKK